MQPSMVIVVPQQTGYAGVMHLAVSVPRIACLIDGVKYTWSRTRCSNLLIPPSAAATATTGRRCDRWSSWRWHATAPSNSASNCASVLIASGSAPAYHARCDELAAKGY